MPKKYEQTEMGRIIRARRKELGLTLERCAEKLGFGSRQAISQMELGLNRFGNNQRLECLAQFLGLNIDSLQAIRPKRRLCQKKRETPLGDFLTRRRLKVHLTQDKVARRAGVGRFLSDIERGKCLPKHSTLNKIAGALECEIPKKLVPKTRHGRSRKKAVLDLAM